jgi:PKD repeat protein
MKRIAGVKSLKLCIATIMMALGVSTFANLSNADVIIDNGDAATSYTGNWSVSSATGAYGTNSVFGSSNATYTWTFTPTTTGTYELSMWWTAVSSRSNSVPVTIQHAGGTASTTINQTTNGGQWNVINQYTFNAGTAYKVTITARVSSPPSTCADAVKFREIVPNIAPTATISTITPNPATQDTSVQFSGYGTDSDGTIAAYKWTSSIDGNLSDANSFSTSTLNVGTHTISFKVQDDDGEWSAAVTETLTINEKPIEVIIDNNDAATSGTGYWRVSSAAGAYGTNSLWSFSGATYTWTFTPTISGTYKLAMWWTALTSRSSSVPVSIQYNGGTATATINQQSNGGQWNDIGEYTFIAGTAYNVTITAPAGTPPSTCADAVKFTKTATINTPPTAIIDSISPSPADVGQSVQFRGHGTDGDGTITAYSWSSSIDGQLSDANSFSTASLTPGVHTIIFEVQDDDGEWSVEVLGTLTIGNPSNEKIIDNGDTATSYTGSWPISGATGAYGPNSLYGSSGATYTWKFTPQVSGTYKLSMWWTELSTRNSSVPVTIQNNSGTASATINQQANGGKWNDIGQYGFNAGTTYNVTITARVVSPPSTCADAVKFTLVTSNSTPIATIDSITPNPATTGSAVQFKGHGSDTDGTITAYKWTSSIDGNLSDANSFSTSTLSPGTHTISFMVQDDAGAWSEAFTSNLVVQQGDIRPIATITSITPNPTTYGQTITFAGSGSDSDGTIQAYRWTSNINGILSTNASFSSSLLSPGTHTISFTVEDNEGKWSLEATQTLTINAVNISFISDNGSSGTTSTGTWNISTAAGAYGTNSLFSSNGATYTWSFTPTTSGTYDVSLWWTALSTRSTSVPYAIQSNSGTTTKTINQRSNGGKWNSQGNYNLTAGNTYTVKVTAQSVSNASCADAVKWQLGSSTNNAPTAQITSISPNPVLPGSSVEFLGAGFDSDGTISEYEWTSSIDGALGSTNNFTKSSLTQGVHTISLRVKDNSGNWSTTVTQTLIVGADDIIMDNGDSGTSYTGTWYSSTSASGYYGSNYLWGENSATYTYRIKPTITANYEVFAWWAAYTSRNSNTPYTIVNASGTTTVYVNQQQNGGKWNSLGVFPFQAGVTYTITITAASGDALSTCADAIKLSFSGLVSINLPPAAEILTITPNPGMPNETIVFTGKAVDEDGSVTGYNWRSDIDGQLGTTRILNKKLTSGTHKVYFKAQDNTGAWSPEVSANVDVGLEHMYIALCYGGNEIGALSPTSVLQSLGATQSSTYEWTYTNPTSGKKYYIHFVRNSTDLLNGMKRDGSHIIVSSHSNYGLGYIFSTSTEDTQLMLTNVKHVDDDRIIKFGTPMVGVSAYGMRTGQAYPYWWPIYKDGTSAIAPYDFNDANGPPAYNYYLTYQVPGDPNHYKVETVRNSAIQRFSDSSKSAWYSINGSEPDPTKYEDRQYFITNSASWSPSIESSGTWTQYQDLPANRGTSQYFKENYVYNAAGSGNDYMRFMFTIPAAGQYKVSAWWPAISTNAANAPFTVYHANGSTTLNMNQTTNGQRWNDLGTYNFNAGDYSVLLTDAASSGNIIADGVRVGHINNPDDVVQSDFVALPMTGNAPLNVMFVNSGTGDLTERTWDTGDNYTNTTRDMLYHEYINPGTYTVKLTVKGPMGTSTKTKTAYITVYPEGTTYTPTLKAEFGMMNKFSSTSSFSVPLAAIFMDASDGNVVSRLWNFGDGQTSTEKDPVHVYTSPGNYQVSLTVTDGTGATKTETKPNYVRAVVFEKNIDNVDYPKTSYGGWVGKTMLKTKSVDIARDDLKYGRMLLESCNSGDYYIQSVAHSKMFYTVGSSTGQGLLSYLRNYLLGYNDDQIWEAIQQVQAVYDFYDFNLHPDQQSNTNLTSLSTLSNESLVAEKTLSNEEQSAIDEMKSMSLTDVYETLSTPEYMTNETLCSAAIEQAYSGSEEQAVELAIARIKTPIEDNNGISEMKTAKSIIMQYPDIAIPRILSLYPQDDIEINANIITAAGVLAGNKEIKTMLTQALLDTDLTTDDNPELVGQPLRICDIAYNQLVLNLKIKDVLRTIGTGMPIETRDYHISVLKAKL